MKRYDHSDGGMDLEPDGEYVRYEDAAARISALGRLVDQADKVLGLVLDKAEEQKARIAEMEMFKQQWAVADAALVGARRRIAKLEAELAEMKNNLHK